ncbi:MAG: tetratricopeptide repeat protein [Actinomycetia bacterium]|nr:tetratricopeptide repeat protein [Actinomycetes bacterium]
MNSTNYDEATIAYNSGDYIKALEGYYQCLSADKEQFAPGDAGLVYHRVGNCLVKVERYPEAIAAYRQALTDPDYPERGSLYVNLGTALAAQDQYDEAIEQYQAALADTSYTTPYRAWMGLGNALSKLGRVVEAGTAYRTAALDESNPNPVKALMNLGASFSALGRPADAVEAYLAILDFRVTGNNLNRTYERLGNAYFADGRYAEAVQAFNDAQLGAHYQLSDRSLSQLAEARLFITGNIGAPVESPDAADAVQPRNSLEDSSSLEPLDAEMVKSFSLGSGSAAAEDTDFFTATDADLIAAGKRQLRLEKKIRHTGLKIFFGILVVIVLLLGGAIVAFTQGFGWPTQNTVINNFFDAYAANGSVTDYWVANAQSDPVQFAQALRVLPAVPASAVTVESLDRSMSTSTALISVRLPEGGILHYQLTLVRDGLGWRISGANMIFASQSH